jgi:hypothetical protein
MSSLLAGTKSFSFKVHALTEEILDDGQKVEFARNSTVTVRRPDHLAVTAAGDHDDMKYVYDGKQITIHNVRNKVYGQIPLPNTIDGAFDELSQKHDMVIPLADLVTSDPYKGLAPLIRSGEYLGLGYVFDVKCHHLAFRQEAVDWQIWLDQGDKPLPRKIIITYKDSPARLQYVAYLTAWDLTARFDEGTFSFVPAADDKKIDAVTPATRPADAKN